MLKAKEMKFIVWDEVLQFLRSNDAVRSIIEQFNYTKKEKEQLVDMIGRVADQVQLIRNKYGLPETEAPLVPEVKNEG